MYDVFTGYRPFLKDHGDIIGKLHNEVWTPSPTKATYSNQGAGFLSPSLLTLEPSDPGV